VRVILWAVAMVIVTGWSAMSFPVGMPACSRSILCLTPWGKWGLSVVILCWLVWPLLERLYRRIRWAMAIVRREQP
jgi:hypothetical protein